MLPPLSAFEQADKKALVMIPSSSHDVKIFERKFNKFSRDTATSSEKEKKKVLNRLDILP